MNITLSTRRLLTMLKDAYKAGAMVEKVKDPAAENLEGVAETVAMQIKSKYEWLDDYTPQQQ